MSDTMYKKTIVIIKSVNWKHFSHLIEYIECVEFIELLKICLYSCICYIVNIFSIIYLYITFVSEVSYNRELPSIHSQTILIYFINSLFLNITHCSRHLAQVYSCLSCVYIALHIQFSRFSNDKTFFNHLCHYALINSVQRVRLS